MPAVLSLVRDEIVRPDVIQKRRAMLHDPIDAGAQATPFVLFSRHSQTLAPTQSGDPFLVHWPALSTQKLRHTRRPEPGPLPCQFVQPGDEPFLEISPACLIPLGRSRLTQRLAGPTLRQFWQTTLNAIHQSPSRRATQFPNFRASSRICLSSVRSATVVFKRLFCCSSSLSRFASSAFMPPY